MDISINEQNQEHIKRMVESGDFDSPDEVVDTALRLLTERQQKIAALRGDIEEGFASGDPLPGEEVMAELHRKATEQLQQD